MRVGPSSKGPYKPEEYDVIANKRKNCTLVHKSDLVLLIVIKIRLIYVFVQVFIDLVYKLQMHVQFLSLKRLFLQAL